MSSTPETNNNNNDKNVPENDNENDDALSSQSSSTTNTSTSSFSHAHDPFFAFVPQLFGYGARVVCHELQLVQTAVTHLPQTAKRFTLSTHDYYKTHPRVLYDEIISGFTVAIMQVPESIAFSFVAGVPPLSGLHATFWMATITGLLGGKPGMISGAAGALAVVVDQLTLDDGVLDYLENNGQRLDVLYMTMFVCGCMQVLFALFRLAKLVRLIPETGMIGFMNGLAIIIFMAQLPAFMKCDQHPLFVECSVDQRQWLTFQDDTWQLVLSLVHVGICMIIMKYFHVIPYIGKIVPASLVALLVGTLLEHTLFRNAFDVSTRTVKETAEMSGSLPKFDWPAIPNVEPKSKTIGIILEFAVTLAAIGSVESVLTLQACNEITDTVPKVSDSNQELFAQGLANLVCGLFRAMGGDAMIGQSTINIMNGARHRVSSTMSGIFMLLFVVAIGDFIELLPVATLTGVLFMVVLSTFQWQTFQILRYGRLSDSGVILIVTLVAVFFNLAVAIACGIIFSALVHAWDSGACVEADIIHKKMIVNDEEVDVKYCHIKGSIFFSSTRHFISKFSVSNDPATVIIDLKDALIIDHSAVAAIEGITRRFAQADKKVLLVNVPKKSHGRLHRTGDHKVLRDQITCTSKIEDVKPTVEEARQGDEEAQTPTSNSSAEQIPQPAPVERTRSDELNEVGCTSLAGLSMFRGHFDDPEHELRKLQDHQGTVDIHEKDE